jgi:putative membrane protein
MMLWNGMNGWGMLLVAVSAVVFVVMLVTGVALLVQQSAGRQILAARYARGELDDEEYRRQLTNIRRGLRDQTRREKTDEHRL